MPNRRKCYKDMDKFRKTRREQRRRYYAKTNIYEPRPWTASEEEQVLRHEITDTELSYKIRRSVASIQKRRHLLKRQS